MNIIVRGKGNESERRKKESAVQILKHYYSREIRDGSKFRLPKTVKSKDQIKRLYDEISNS